MEDLKLTDDEKANILRQRIKNMEAEVFNRELTVRFSESEEYKGDPGAVQAATEARSQIEEIRKGIDLQMRWLAELTGIELPHEETNGNGATPIRGKIKK